MALAKGLLDLGRAAIDLGDDAYRNLLRLIEAGYPDTTALKIVTGELPMDNASRMARATEQGKTQLAYHTSNNPMVKDGSGYEPTDQGLMSFDPEMRKSSWFATDPYTPQSYAKRKYSDNAASYPVLMDTRGMENAYAKYPAFKDYPRNPQHWSNIRDPRVVGPDGKEITESYGSKQVPIYDNQTMDTDELAWHSQMRGADGVVINDVIDIGPSATSINKSLRNVGIDPKQWMQERSKKGGTSIAVNDGSTVRSLLSAAFDPDQVNTNNLLATNPAATTLAGLLSLLGISEADGLLSNNRYD
jgi:hypothetical protein